MTHYRRRPCDLTHERDAGQKLSSDEQCGLRKQGAMEDAMFQVSGGHSAKMVPLRLVRKRPKQDMLRMDFGGSHRPTREREVNDAKPACVNKL